MTHGLKTMRRKRTKKPKDFKICRDSNEYLEGLRYNAGGDRDPSDIDHCPYKSGQKRADWMTGFLDPRRRRMFGL